MALSATMPDALQQSPGHPRLISPETHSMEDERLTPEEFESLRPRLGRHTIDTVDLARAVLVEGKSQSDVARETGFSRQRVSQIVKRVKEVISDVPPLWEQVNVWLPPAEAERVRQLAIDARIALYDKSKHK